MFDTLESRIIIDYEIWVRSDLHIGGHDSGAPGAVDMGVMKDVDGYPFVPGSSLKGVLRSEMERLLKGLGKRACSPDPDKLCKAGEECTVCLLFGGREVAGSIKVRDAYTDSRRTLIRDGVRIDRKTRKAAGGAYYTMEAVPKGTKFKGRITIENPKLGEYRYAKLGALLGTVRFFNATSKSLGGGVSRGFGEVLIVPRLIREITADDYLEGRYEGRELVSLIEERGLEEVLERGELPMRPDDAVDRFIGDWKGYVEAMEDGGKEP
ncbi:MAG: hypothetical protein CW694_04965 [Candidatus Syntrophoarchaeum sp. WYZ-LMO15]|nr:MAG: hypothetical protein CW694_04965 [Candidatus Syntrophoarchaeum sp. WYZ-LMO15]